MHLIKELSFIHVGFVKSRFYLQFLTDRLDYSVEIPLYMTI